MSFRISGDDQHFENIQSSLKDAGHELTEKGKTAHGHTVYTLTDPKQKDGKALPSQEVVNILANRIASLTRQLQTHALIENGAENLERPTASKEEIEKALNKAQEAHKALSSGRFEHHTWTDRTKQGAALAAGSIAFAALGLFQVTYHGTKGAIALLNRGLMMGADMAQVHAEATKGADGNAAKELKLQAIKAYDNLRWGLLTTREKPDYLKAVDMLYKQQCFLESEESKVENPIIEFDNERVKEDLQKKVKDYILHGTYTAFTEKEAKKLGLTHTDHIDVLNEHLKMKLLDIDTAFQNFTVDPKKELIFKEQLLRLMSRRNNFLKFVFTAGFKRIPTLEAPRRDDELFTATRIKSSILYQVQKSLQGTSNRILKDMIASSDQALAAIKLIEEPGFVKRISKGLLNAVQNSTMDPQGKLLVLQALFENCSDDRGREKIMARIPSEVAAQWIRAKLSTNLSEEVKRHLILLSLESGDTALIKETTGIDTSSVTVESLRDHPLISELYKSSEGQHAVFYALRSGHRQLAAALADAMRMAEPKKNAYLTPDLRGRKPIHYMTRRDATWFDNHYIGKDGKVLDGTKTGSFSGVLDRLEALHFQAKGSRIATGALLGKMIGSAVSTGIILSSSAPGWSPTSLLGPTTMKDELISAVETNGPVYAGLISGAFITFPLQKLANTLYVWQRDMKLDLSQYEASKSIQLDDKEILPSQLHELKLPLKYEGMRTAEQWKQAIQDHDPVAIATLISENKPINLSRDQLRELANIRYFPKLQSKGKTVDTQQAITHYFLTQSNKAADIPGAL